MYCDFITIDSSIKDYKNFSLPMGRAGIAETGHNEITSHNNLKKINPETRVK